MLLDIENLLKGTRRGHILQEWFTNSIHFPVANIILELLLETPSEYLLRLDPYVILAASLVQAYFLGSWRYRGNPRPFLGNLIAPTIYTVTELLVYGLVFFSSPHHLAYWEFSLVIGFLQCVQLEVTDRLANLFILLEHLARTCPVFIICLHSRMFNRKQPSLCDHRHTLAGTDHRIGQHYRR